MGTIKKMVNMGSEKIWVVAVFTNKVDECIPDVHCAYRNKVDAVESALKIAEEMSNEAISVAAKKQFSLYPYIPLSVGDGRYVVCYFTLLM